MPAKGNPDLKGYIKDYWTDRVLPKLGLVEGWARNGLSNAQIATNLGIAESTFSRYIGEHEQLKDILREAREDAEIIVENAMFKRATGYTVKERTQERVRQLDEEGEWTGKYIMRTTKIVTKHIQGDFNAQAYWLEHRAPRRWEKTPKMELDITNANDTIKSLAELLRKPVKARPVGSEIDD